MTRTGPAKKNTMDDWERQGVST